MVDRLFRWIVLLAVVLAAALSGVAAAQPQQGPTVAQAEEQVRQLRAAMKGKSAPPEQWSALMMAEVMLLSLRAQQSGAVDEAALQAEQRALSQRILAEWKAAQPDDPTPYLSEMQGTVPPEQMDDAVLALLPRFPDNARLLGRVLYILTQREETERAAQLLETALEHHPERSDLYKTALAFYTNVNNETRRRELAAAWIERRPDDPEALRAWLSHQPAAARSPQESAARIERFVGASDPAASDPASDPARVDVCRWLLTAEDGAYRDAAVRCLSGVRDRTRDAELRARVAGILVSAGISGGDGRELAQTLAGLPPERRLDAVLTAVNALGPQQCARKMSLLQALPWDGTPTGGRLPDYFRALHDCTADPAVRAAYLDALQRAPAGDLGNLLSAGFVNVNGRYLDPSGDGPRVAAALEGRLQRRSNQVEVWQALATAYAIAGWDERRAAHLSAWLGKDLAPPERQDLVWLGTFRAAQSPQAGIDALRLALRKTHDTEVAAALGDLLLAAGKMDDLAALVDGLARGQEGTSGLPGADLARLLRARATLVRRGPEAALADYQVYVDGASYLKPEDAGEYLMVVAGVRGAPAAEQAAQALCAKEGVRSILTSIGTPSQCAADLLAKLGHSEGALRLLAAAAERSPEDLGMQSRYAWAAEQTGDFARAEQAYRRMLTLDPKSEGAWIGLGRMVERRGDPAELETVLHQAAQARGEEPATIVLALARWDTAHGRAARAVERLTALRDRRPGTFVGETELRAAYAALASEPGVTAAPSTAGATLPTAEHLRAAREAESFLLGLGGPIDEAKGRETVKTLAQSGNPYANIRLAVWEQAGTQGFTSDPRLAAATAAPYLPAVRAAAEGGEPFAQYLWGTALLRGLGVPKQASEGGAWLRKAAEHGEPWALHNLGWMAEQGDGTARDLPAAIAWYQRGAAAGNPFSMLSLATLRITGDPAVRNPAEGLQWLEKAAERSLPKAVAWYAALLLYGLPGEGAPIISANPSQARPWLEKAAALGEVGALYDLGRDFLVGAGGPVDERRGVELLEQAAGQGNVRAMWQLVWQTALGRGALHDGARAEQWIERAAAEGYDEPGYIVGAGDEDDAPARDKFARGLRQMEQLAAGGDAFAGGLLARLYLEAVGVKMDFTRAIAFARPAAAGGSTEAMRVLGWAYREGNGVEPDPAQAAAWFRRGAEGGNSYCMMWYSQMLFRGEGVTADPPEALAWLERSGEKGNAWAVRDLGHLYDEGWHDIPRDEAKAAYWKRKALAFDDQEARGWLLAHGLTE
jgi:TPR repeat protein/Flp pilus assembly protein TadD